MKKSCCILIVIAFSLFYWLSCDKASNPVQSDISSEAGMTKLAKGRPPKDEPPVIDLLEVLNPDGTTANTEAVPVQLPDPDNPGDNPAIIHYKVSDDVAITEIIIEILRDNDKDNQWEVMFSERLFRETLTFDGSQKSITGYLPWCGNVYTGYSDDGYVFDQLATENPDVYLYCLLFCRLSHC